MGLGIGQLGELTAIARKHDIGRQLQHLSLEKTALTRDMRNVTQDYQRALNKKSLKWSSNAGVSYTDISYNTLMRPNQFNSKSPILVTDAAGKVIIDPKYKKYAEMISESGSVGGSYDGETRLKILQELAGVTAEQIQAYDSTASNVQTAVDAVNDAVDARDKISSEDFTQEEFIKEFLDKSNLGLSDTEVTVNNVESILSTVKDAIIGKDYFSPEIEKSIDKSLEQIREYIKTEDDKMPVVWHYKKNLFSSSSYSTKDLYKMPIDDFITRVAAAIIGENKKIHVMYDSDNKTGTYSAYEAALKAHSEATADYKQALSDNGQVYTSEEKIKIDYYDALFTSIADNGWKYDGSVSESEYLAQSLQNNRYFITTIEKNSCFDPDLPESIRNYNYTYSTDLAANFDNIYMVSDSDAREEALVEYEYKKQIISDKEAKIDTRMQNLKTEQESITKMLESYKKTVEDNIDKTMKLWA